MTSGEILLYHRGEEMTDVKETTNDNLNIPSDSKLPTTFGDFTIRVFHEEKTGFDHVALTLGDMQGPDPVLIRFTQSA